MYQLLAETQVNPVKWNDDVMRLNGCAFHSHEWSVFSSEKGCTNPVYLSLRDRGGNPVALAIGFQTSKSVFGKNLFKTISFGSFPAANGSSAVVQMVQAIYNFSQDNSFMVLSMNSFGTPGNTDILNEMGFITKKRWEFILDLQIDKDQLWKTLPENKRRLINKAKKQGVIVKKGETLVDFLSFRDLALATKERKENEGIQFPVADAQYYSLLKDMVLDKGVGLLYLAFLNGDCIGGSFFAKFNQRAYYQSSAATDRGLEAAAPHLIVWEAITDLKGEDFRILNLGGVSEGELQGRPLEEAGLYIFKKRFATTVIPCYKGELCLRPKSFRLYSLLKRLKEFTAQDSN